MGLLDLWRAYVESEGWQYGEVEEVPILVLPFRGPAGAFVCYVEARGDTVALCWAEFPDVIPEDRRVDVALFLTRANRGLPLGNFELDLDGGDLRFKCSVDVSGVEANPALLAPLVSASVTAMERYLPGLRSVIRGSRTVVEAIEASGG